MPVRKLGHYSVRTAKLEESERFYVDVLGLRVGFRPKFDFPGTWLYPGHDDADYGVVHLISSSSDGHGLTAYLGERTGAEQGTGALDHLAFMADDVDEFRARLERNHVPYRERDVPDLPLHQLFFVDPSGLTIEMNFPSIEVQRQVAPSTSTRPIKEPESEIR